MRAVGARLFRALFAIRSLVCRRIGRHIMRRDSQSHAMFRICLEPKDDERS